MFYAMNVRKRFLRSQNEAVRISTSKSRIIFPVYENLKDARLAESQSAQQTSSKSTKQHKKPPKFSQFQGPAIIKNRNKKGEHKTVFDQFLLLKIK